MRYTGGRLIGGLIVAAGAALTILPPAHADSLFTQAAQKSGTLVTEAVERFEVGDIITVQVIESIEATTEANTITRKESNVDSKAGENDNRFLVGTNSVEPMNADKLPNWKVKAKNETRNRGETVRSSTLETTITCAVVEILANGNLIIEGDKQVSVNREDSTLHLRGIVRPKDVTAANTVPSTKIAGTQLQLKGKGPLWNNQRRGLITRFLDWFSPF